MPTGQKITPFLWFDAIAAMMTMKKLDIAQLTRAYRGQ